MSVSKRLRFEVLRRDNHTCQYCGEKAPDVTLHVDHVVPVSLGGSDKPDNLVAACKDCNLGKTSVPADAPLVASVGEMAATYALNMTERMTLIRATLEAEDAYLDDFDSAWNKWTYSGTNEAVARPADYKSSIYRFARMGVPIQLVERAIDIAMNKQGLRDRGGEFSYMAGVIWRSLDEVDIAPGITEEAVHVYTALEVDDMVTNARIEGYEMGCKVGA